MLWCIIFDSIALFDVLFRDITKLITYQTQFKEVADKDDLLGTEDVVKRTGFFGGSKSVPLKNRQTVFTLGNRANILTELESAIMVPTSLEGTAKDTHLTYEQIFRSIHVSYRSDLYSMQ